MTATPDAVLQKEGLWASAYRLVTAPFSIRTLRNITRNNRRKSSPSKLVHIDEIADNLDSGAGKLNAAPVGTNTTSDSMQLPTPHVQQVHN